MEVQETVVQTPTEASKESEIDRFLTERKAVAEKTEKRNEQLAKAREAKAEKAAAAKEPEEPSGGPELAEPDEELAEFVESRKKKDPVLKGKPKAEEPKAEEPAPKEEPADAAEEEEPKEATAPAKEEEEETDEPEGDPKKVRAEEAKKFAALARREKAAVEREKAAETALKQVQEHATRVEQSAKQYVEQERQKLAQTEQEYKRVLQLFEQSRRSPRALLEMAGFSVKDAVDEVVEERTPQAVLARDLERQMAQYRREMQAQFDAERQAREAAEKSARQQAEAAAIASFRADINDFLAKNADTYELIGLYGDQDRVWRTIEQHFEKHGVLPEIKDAADAVEEDLHEKSKRIRGAKKFRTEEEPAAKTQVASQKQDNKPAAKARAATTLTNDMVSAPRTEPSGDPLLSMTTEDAMEALAQKYRKRRSA